MKHEIYEPREDSYLILKHVKRLSSSKKVLDVGTGSGILAKEALKIAKKVSALDINQNAVNNLLNVKGLDVFKSDLFSKVSDKFDLIIFNPPYLPYDSREPKSIQKYTTGGKKGYETLVRFIESVSDYLKIDGKVLIVFSSLTCKDKVDEVLVKNLLDFKLIDSCTCFFEELFVYEICKSKFLKTLEKKEVTEVAGFNHGKRGNIYVGKFKGTKVAIKKQREDSEVQGTVNFEFKALKKLNESNIGPKVLFFGKDYFVYEYVPGKFIEDYFVHCSKQKCLWVLRSVMKQMFVLDSLGYTKEEMQHPPKHIIVGKKVVLLDFERCRIREKNHNVTQFCSYVRRLRNTLMSKGIKIDCNKLIKLAKEYRKDKNKFKEILRLF